MEIYVRDLNEQEMIISDTIAFDDLGELLAVNFQGLIKVDAKVHRVGNTLIVKVNVMADFLVACHRCAEEFASQWGNEFWLDFEIDVKTEYVKIDEEVRQEILVGMPPQILCSKDCRGVCPGCGINLNQGQCQCSK